MYSFRLIFSSFGTSDVLFLVSITIFCSYFLGFIFQRWKKFAQINNLNGPTAFPIIGNAYLFFRAKSTIDLFNVWDKIFTTYDFPMRVWLGPHLAYVTVNPNEIQTILYNHSALRKGFIYKFLVKLVGKGLLTAEVPKWKKMRKIISPTFSQNILNTFHPIMLEKSKKLCRYFKENVRKDNVDVFETINKITVETICETAMGIDENSNTSKFAYGNISTRILKIIVLKIFNALCYIDFAYKQTNIFKQENDLAEEINGFINQVTQERRRSYFRHVDDLKSNNHAQVEESSPKKRFLDYLIDVSNKEGLTDQEIIDEVSVFLFGGSDTTATTLSFTLMCLGLHPEIQDKIYTEISNEIGLNRYVEVKDLANLKYTEMVIKEVLRIFPAIPMIGREIVDDIRLENITLPSGLLVLIPIIALQRNPKYWPDPLYFNPERHRPEETAKRHPLQWLPFSAGPRNCIGMRYAMMSLKTMLVTIVKDFKITTGYKNIEEIELDASIVIKPLKGCVCSFTLRENA